MTHQQHTGQTFAPKAADPVPPQPETRTASAPSDSPYSATYRERQAPKRAAEEPDCVPQSESRIYVKAHLGFWSAILAAVGSIACSVMLGIVMGDKDVRFALEYDYNSSELSYVWLLLMVQLLWTAMGLTGLVLGIISTSKRQHRGLGIGAIVVASAAPFISYTAWLATTAFSAASAGSF